MRRRLGAAARNLMTLFDDGCPDEFHDLTSPQTEKNRRGDVISFQYCRICGLNVTKFSRAKEAN